MPFCVFQKYGFLLRRETIKTWTVFTCLNCRKKTHSINRELKVILVNKDMEVSNTLAHLSILHLSQFISYHHSLVWTASVRNTKWSWSTKVQRWVIPWFTCRPTCVHLSQCLSIPCSPVLVCALSLFTCLNCRKINSISQELKVTLVNKDGKVTDTPVHLFNPPLVTCFAFVYLSELQGKKKSYCISL